MTRTQRQIKNSSLRVNVYYLNSRVKGLSRIELAAAESGRGQAEVRLCRYTGGMSTASSDLGSDAFDRNGSLSERQVHIVRSAYRLFSDRGVERVPIHEIAAAAGVSKSVVLYYFRSKEKLVGVTMSWVLDEIGDRIRRAVAQASTPEEAVRAMIGTIFRGPQPSRRFYLTYLDLIDHAARVSGFGRLGATFRSTVNAVYAELIRSGIAAGTFQVVDIEEAATVVRAIVEGLHFQWLQEDAWEQRYGWYKETCTAAVLAYLLNAGAISSEAI